MKETKRYLVTAALPYANGPLHIGHLAGAYLSGDIFARFQRLMGKEVLFICGSDENGAAITIRAAKEGKKPQDIVDFYHKQFKDTFEKMGISFDYYHRTSAALHHETSQDFFRTLNQSSQFEKKESEQYYDERENQFLADRYIKGTCPNCQYDNAYGDQCEKCGSALSPIELINPVSTISGNKPVLKKTTHWYLPLNKYEAWLKDWINTGKIEDEQLHDPETWKNHVLGQCKSWLEGGLIARSMTRDLTWGVDVPQELDGSLGKKLYVWLDAPIGYISATKQWAKEKEKDWKKYWQDQESSLVHFIGKDNIVFHCIIFPAILRAHGSYILPKNVPANQFMNLEGDKISTSRNWAVWVHEYLEDFPDKQDELRYCLIRNMPEQKDSEFTWKNFQELNNNELVNNLANFVNRVVVLTNKYYDGKVPIYNIDQSIVSAHDINDASYHDSEMLGLFDMVDELSAHVRKYDLRAALQSMMEISSRGNQLLQFNEPWKTIKTDEESVKVVMNVALQIVTTLSVVSKIFLPFTSSKIRKLLNLPALVDDGADLLEIQNKLSEGFDILKDGHQIGKPKYLFQRIDDTFINSQIDKLQSTKKEEVENPIKKEISFDEFIKMDIRTATIISAEKVKKADKLLQLELDLGFEKRTVVSGIAAHFTPEEVIGKTVSLLANLAPRKIRGVESRGMILMAENEEGKLDFVAPATGWPNGMSIK